MRTVAAKPTGKWPIALTAGSIGPKTSDKANDYLARVRAYVPVEVVAFFIFVNALVLGTALMTTPADGSPSTLTPDGYVALLALVTGAAAAWLLTYAASKKKNGGRAAVVQSVVSVFAFGVWAYAMGARGFEVVHLPVVPSVAGLMLGAFTLFSGLVVPVKAKEPSTSGQAVRKVETTPAQAR